MAAIRFSNPKELGTPLGPYSQTARVRAVEHLYVAGQVGIDANGKIADGFEAQCDQLYANIETALKAEGASWANVVQFTSYLGRSADIANYMVYRARAYPTFFPARTYPTHTLLIVSGFVRDALLIEVQATAVFS